MRTDLVVIILKPRKELKEHGHTESIKLLDDYPLFEGNPILCEKSGPSIFTKKHRKLIFEFTIEKMYNEDEARELFPECFI